MRKRVAKARVHSQCGQTLERIVFCEVIPAGFYSFVDKKYKEDIPSDEMPELCTEYRCAACNEVLKGADLEYVSKRIEDNGERQITQEGTEETEEGQVESTGCLQDVTKTTVRRPEECKTEIQSRQRRLMATYAPMI